MIKFTRMLLSAIALGLLSGCISYRATKEIKFDDPPRVSVKFESAEAADLFYNKVRERQKDCNDPSVGYSRFGIAFVFVHEGRTVHANALYNALVDKADINKDGTITLAEAQALR